MKPTRTRVEKLRETARRKKYLRLYYKDWYNGEVLVEACTKHMAREAAYQRARVRRIVKAEFTRMAGHPILVDVLAAL